MILALWIAIIPMRVLSFDVKKCDSDLPRRGPATAGGEGDSGRRATEQYSRGGGAASAREGDGAPGNGSQISESLETLSPSPRPALDGIGWAAKDRISFETDGRRPRLGDRLPRPRSPSEPWHLGVLWPFGRTSRRTSNGNPKWKRLEVSALALCGLHANENIFLVHTILSQKRKRVGKIREKKRGINVNI